MNEENIKRVIALISAAPEEMLDMTQYSSKTLCGTAYCLAGWALFDERGEPKHPEDSAPWSGLDNPDCMLAAANVRFGLSAGEGVDLFILFDRYDADVDTLGRVTKATALSVLHHLLDTGKVDWPWAHANPWQEKKELPVVLTQLLEGKEPACLIEN